MKNTLLLSFIFICFIIVFSCQKRGLLPSLPLPPDISNPPVDTTPVDTTNTYYNAFGVFVNETDGMVIPQMEEAELIHELGGDYARLSISNRNWMNDVARNNFLTTYKAFAAQQPAIKTLLNINWVSMVSNAKQPYPGASTEYQQFFNSVLDTLTSGGYDPPALIVVENEENNPNKHLLTSPADQDRYIDMLKFAVTACHKRNLKISNGGLTNLAIIFLVKDYLSRIVRDTVAANKFTSDCWPADEIEFWNKHSDSAVAKLDIAKHFMDNYKLIGLDYINIHWYEPVKCVFSSNKTRIREIDTLNINPDVLKTIYRYFDDPQTAGGKPLICNETGQVTSSPSLPLQILCMMRRLPFAIYYSGDRPSGIRLKRPFGQYSLFTAYSEPPYYAIRLTGTAYKNAVESIRADPYGFCQLYYPKGE